MYYKMAANENALAANNFAFMCINGEGGEKDLETACKYFKIADELDDVNGTINYAIMLFNAGDTSKALEYFQRAGNKGHVDALIWSHHLKMMEIANAQKLSKEKEKIEIPENEPKTVEIELVDTQSHYLADGKGSGCEVEPAVKEVAALSLQESGAVLDLELVSELKEIENKLQEDIQRSKLKKQSQKVSSRLTMTVSKTDYDQTTANMSAQMVMDTLQETKHIVSSDTFDLVNTIFGKGNKKINSFTNRDAWAAFKDLGCVVDNKSGTNFTIVSLVLKEGRVMKFTYDNPHGHDRDRLYNDLKPFFKRFLVAINKTPELLSLR